MEHSEKHFVYLDNAATTMVCPEALSAAREAAESIYANPSSLHRFGFEAERLVSSARGAVAETVGALPEEIYFTSGGTFGDNLALLGAARRNKKRGRHIIISSIEHSAVENAAKRLEDSEGFEVSRIPPDASGHIRAQDVAAAVRKDTVLVSVMLVNNELGTIQPLKEITEAVRQKNADTLLHTDAVQAYTKIKTDVRELGVHMMTMSGHKIHALKGTGAVYIKKGTKIEPLIYGGGQESGLAPGTEPVPGILSFAAAAKAAFAAAGDEKEESLRGRILDALGALPEFRVISRGDIPYIFMVSLKGLKGETVLHYLEERGICVSTGSACSKGKPSRVLSALGLEKDVLDGALRISLSRFTTRDDAERLIEALLRAPGALVKKKR